MVSVGFRLERAVFFDRNLIIHALGIAQARTLSRFGAYVRRTARWSIRQRKRISTPGHPPSSHTGILRNFLYFGYDPRTQSVVVGPAITNQIFFDMQLNRRVGLIPPTLEFGGQYKKYEAFWPGSDGGRGRGRGGGGGGGDGGGGKWFRVDLRSPKRVAKLRKRYRTVKIRPRPYMGPALEKEVPKFTNLWLNSVKAA